MNLYLTADKIGAPSGGGAVTHHELLALRSLGAPVDVIGRDELLANAQEAHDAYQRTGFPMKPEPWVWDDIAAYTINRDSMPKNYYGELRLAHVYAGTFSESVQTLFDAGVKVTYTAAAHCVKRSKEAHEQLGLPYDYPHLTDDRLFAEYLRGYKTADVLICPSVHSCQVMRDFGCTQRIEIIPHGVDLPARDALKNTPEKFTVGYLGAVGPDKGLAYLLAAWAKAKIDDGELLIGGAHAKSPFVDALIRHFGGDNVRQAGWYDSVGDFYNCISVYIQPSLTEGFGIEVLEAMAHARPVLCSTGAGAADVVPKSWRFTACDVDELAQLLRYCYDCRGRLFEWGLSIFRSEAENYTWDKIRSRYAIMWKGLLRGLLG